MKHSHCTKRSITALKLRPLAIAFVIACASIAPLHAANFNYHGDLIDGDAPASGRYDLRVRTFAQADSKAALGGAVELPDVDVIDGSFAVELDLPESKIGDTWVEVAVRKADSGEAYEVLGALQKLAKANNGCWALDGNTGLAAGSFLGNADPASTAPLVLRARNTAIGTFTPRGTAAAYGDAPSIALGSAANRATDIGATVAGGGASRTFQGAACPECANVAEHFFATVGGGHGNKASHSFTTVAGGLTNLADGQFGTISGGQLNGADNYAATVGGGMFNQAIGRYSTVPGGYAGCAGGDTSTALGHRAKVRSGTDDTVACGGSNSGDTNGDEGTFVWADNTDADFVSAGPNQFLIRAQGGIGINTTKLGAADDLYSAEIAVSNSAAGPNTDLLLMNATNRGYSIASEPGSGGNAGQFYISEVDARTSNVQFTPRLRINPDGSTAVLNGTVANISDARVKKNIAAIDAPLETLLALRGHTFEYIDPARWMNSPGTRIGFVAQEVREVLPQWIADVGEGYLGVQTSGFEALAVEAIRDLKQQYDAKVDALERANAALLARLDRLEAQQQEH